MKHFYLSLLLISSLNAKDMGALLFNGNCITCHHESTAISAPSISEIKENYLRAFPDKNNFVYAMSTWVKKPSKKTSIMLDAVKTYELMPELGYDCSTLEIISAYLYDTKFPSN
ncbi:MAG: cytochrome c551/c552 [Sulfurimonas sp.]|uniref:cytochrome C n=1 Tax=Sulfurimonas sp. TaxID=2022749 RepID=UPI0039E2E9E7